MHGCQPVSRQLCTLEGDRKERKMSELLKIKLQMYKDRLDFYNKMSNKYPADSNMRMYVAGVVFALDEIVCDLERLLYE